MALNKNIHCRFLPHGVFCLDTISVDNISRIEIAKDFSIRKGTVLECKRGVMKIGKNVFLNRNCIVTCLKAVSVGDNCILGPDIKIYDHDHLYKHGQAVKDNYITKEIVIEKNCWIGAGCIILKGAHIGAGSVIGAGCVITGYIPPDSRVVTDRKLMIKENYG